MVGGFGCACLTVSSVRLGWSKRRTNPQVGGVLLCLSDHIDKFQAVLEKISMNIFKKVIFLSIEICSRLTDFCVQKIENMAPPERAILFLEEQ
jgi:hypothetical protein